MGHTQVEPNADAISQDEEKEEYQVVMYAASALPPNYRSMIFSRWLRSLRFGNHYFTMIDSTTYFDTYHRYIQSLFLRPTSAIRLAVLKDNHDVCLGWSFSEPNKLHYVHVQRDYRRHGICSQLMPKPMTSFSHITRQWYDIWKNKYKDAIFNPF